MEFLGRDLIEVNRAFEGFWRLYWSKITSFQLNTFLHKRLISIDRVLTFIIPTDGLLLVKLLRSNQFFRMDKVLMELKILDS